MSNFFVLIVAIIGWYFFLGMFHTLKGNVAFHLGGSGVTWFLILFLLGTMVIGKFCLGEGK